MKKMTLNWKLFLVAGIIVLTGLTLFGLFTPINVGLSKGTVTVAELSKENYIIVYDVRPFYSMFGAYWLEYKWDSDHNAIIVFCKSRMARIGIHDPVDGLIVDTQRLHNVNVNIPLKVYFSDRSGSRKLIEELDISGLN